MQHLSLIRVRGPARGTTIPGQYQIYGSELVDAHQEGYSWVDGRPDSRSHARRQARRPIAPTRQLQLLEDLSSTTTTDELGYRSYVQFMMDYGRDQKPGGTHYTPLSQYSAVCPWHSEATAGGTSVSRRGRCPPMPRRGA